MRLHHIETTACPTCNAESVWETVDTDIDGNIKEFHGRRSERRRFACGFGLSADPIHGHRIEPIGECRRSAEGKAKQDKRRVFYAAVRTFVETYVEIDDSYRKEVLSDLWRRP